MFSFSQEVNLHKVKVIFYIVLLHKLSFETIVCYGKMRKLAPNEIAVYVFGMDCIVNNRTSFLVIFSGYFCDQITFICTLLIYVLYNAKIK